MIDKHISPNYLVYGTRAYLEEKLGIPCVVKYVGYQQPKEDSFTTISFVNSVPITETKNKDLITERVYMQIGNYAKDIVTLGEQQRVINQLLMYDSIPIINNDYETIGNYSVLEITGGANVPYGVAIEDETESIRNFTDFMTEIQHVKKRLK